MAVRLVIPKSVRYSAYKEFKWGAIGIFAHTLQCGQRWILLLRVGNYRFGYRTHGDATPDHSTYEEAGWHFGKKRNLSGRN